MHVSLSRFKIADKPPKNSIEYFCKTLPKYNCIYRYFQLNLWMVYQHSYKIQVSYNQDNSFNIGKN